MENNYNLLISKIKEKKPLDRLSDNVIIDEISRVFAKDIKLEKKVDFFNERNSGFKQVVKLVRDELNKRYGVFWSSDFELSGHKSSLERVEFYPELYSSIFDITGKVSGILDISCGMNPLSIKFMKGFKGKYYCTELNQKDCDLLNEWFIKNKIDGHATCVDLRSSYEFSFPVVDLVFLFKVFDSVEEKGHKLAEKILKSLKCKYAVVSFSTHTIRGREMNFPNRGWIEKLLFRLGFSYDKLEFSNEIFYVIKINK